MDKNRNARFRGLKGLSNVIVKTAIKTLIVIIFAVGIAACILCFGFPKTVAGIGEKTGNYSMAVTFASIQYTYTGDIEDLARCAEDSILSENDENIVKYCGKLIEDEGFEEYCAQRSGKLDLGDLKVVINYRQFIENNLSSAQTRMEING